ncbi:hypothetical protein [Kangiella sp. TOML190]|uniref:hypothetical protein n=1 Tax=Kangiella sp. TOML190 TaxID=2931351 RepID=UPI00203CD865|nr:hypothetical protein [Kangiella sp. TOML190]
MEGLIPLIINLVSGALGGNIVGKLAKNLSLGTLGNSLAGIIGGGVFGQFILGAMGIDTSAAMDLTGILSSIGGGAAGGGVVMAIIGFIKKMMGGKS